MFRIKSLFILSAFVLLVLIGGFVSSSIFQNSSLEQLSNQYSATAIASVNHERLRERYIAIRDGDSETIRDLRREGQPIRPIKILIVPGHDSEHKGTAYNETYEVELNRMLAGRLYDYLSRDSQFDVILAHTNDTYHPDIQKYFDEERAAIEAFRSEYTEEMDALVESGEVDIRSDVFHNDAPEEAAFRLYGINKWVHDNDVDMVLHVHFNDHAGRSFSEIGTHTGFSIYIPDSQLPNSVSSRAFADVLYNRLQTFFPVSDNPQESEGVIEDMDLIAIGAKKTLGAISVLVEYGYIYEPQFHGATSDSMLSEMAYQTYVSIKTFFGDRQNRASTLLPHRWRDDLEFGETDSVDVLALQTILRLQGMYPPEGTTFNECPITGDFDACTRSGLKELQSLYEIGTTGTLGPSTRTLLHNLYIH